MRDNEWYLSYVHIILIWFYGCEFYSKYKKRTSNIKTSHHIFLLLTLLNHSLTKPSPLPFHPSSPSIPLREFPGHNTFDSSISAHFLHCLYLPSRDIPSVDQSTDIWFFFSYFLAILLQHYIFIFSLNALTNPKSVNLSHLNIYICLANKYYRKTKARDNSV